VLWGSASAGRSSARAAGVDRAPRVGIDVGGTFTDVVVWLPPASGGPGGAGRPGALWAWKLPSTPEDQSLGFAAGLRQGLALAMGDPAATAALIAHGTTVATNAVLERTGAVTAFVTTDGFADLLAIGRQQRPSLYDLTAVRPEPLVPRRLAAGVPERTGPGGEQLLPLDEAAATAALRGLAAAGAESVAVCLLFSFANPAHELRLRELLAGAAPGLWVSLSCEVSPEVREYERASTTVLDAYVGPVMERYLARIARRAAPFGAGVAVMRSGGATMTLEEAAREPVHTLLSGPAAGVRGAIAAAAAEGVADLVSFDMGGTSTDVCLVEGGAPALASESSVGGLPFRTPALAVHTVGAGGGSLLWLDPAGALRAGPASAGAVPGPACYGRGGAEPTVTDAHLVAGHLDPARFLGGRLALDAAAAHAALEPLARRLGCAPGTVAAAGLAAVEAQMAKAIRVVTVERGRDPREFALVAFGGAGPMHATALATALGMPVVLVPPSAGALSALGLLAAPLAADAARSRPMPAGDTPAAARLLAELGTQATEALARQGAAADAVEYRVDCRYRGQAHEVTVPVPVPPARPAGGAAAGGSPGGGAADGATAGGAPGGSPAALEAALAGIAGAFAAAHRARFGWDAAGDPVELVTFRARATGPDPGLRLPPAPAGGKPPRPVSAGRMPGYARAELGAGDTVDGPCAIWGDDATTVAGAGWRVEVGRVGTLILRRSEPGAPWTR
jgi:N-methylhydantoinase A